MKQFLKDTLYLLAFFALVLVLLCIVQYIAYTMPLYLSIPVLSIILAFTFFEYF